MSVERWKKACEAACCDSNYRSHYGLTETRDDYFVDGVQWADEHPKEEPVSEELEEAAEEWDESLYRSDAFKAGAKWQKEQMMAKAIDAELYSDGMFIPLIGVKDREKVSDIKFGDKVKVIIIKED
jgi:hypothetical protein